MEEERIEFKNELIKADRDAHKLLQKSDARVIMLKNRLYVLAQYLRVTLPVDEVPAEELIDILIDEVKLSFEAP